MYQLLVVDDEEYAREGIMKTIDWDSVGITNVYGAECADASVWPPAAFPAFPVLPPFSDGVFPHPANIMDDASAAASAALKTLLVFLFIISLL